MSVGFSKKPKDADKDPNRRPQTVTVADANGQRTMSLEEYRASQGGQRQIQRQLNALARGGVAQHPDIIFGANNANPSQEETAYRARYNSANQGMEITRPWDAVKNIGAMIAIAAGGAAASGWAPGTASAAPTSAGVSGVGGGSVTSGFGGSGTLGSVGTTGTLAGSGAPATVGGLTTNSGLGVFGASGTAGIGTVGSGNAGLLAATGGIGGGAGIGGTVGGALGPLSGAANAVSGVGGGGMGWNWDTLLDVGVPLLGGLLEADGAKDAARASAAGSAAALAENRRQYDTTRQDMMPWLEAGRGALGRLQDPNAFTQSPGYNFVRNEGMRGVENSFAARGGAASGNALRALSEFNTGLASQEHNNWWNQQAGMAGLGQTTAQNLGSFGANAAANAGGFMQNQANARASGIAGQTNAWTNILGNLGSVWGRRNG